MQKSTTTTISDRLRGILTSFVGQDRNSSPLLVCAARDRDSFIERVRSFRSSSWFAKPHWLSPVICARYGWINIDIDLLRCVGCQSMLVVRAPSSFDPAIYNACQKRLEDQLKQSAHHPCCTWPSCPTPEVVILAHGSSSSQAAVMEDFINKALLLYSVGTYLPVVDRSALNITESDIAALCDLVKSSPKFPHDNEIPGAVESAVLLSLVGWNLSDGDTDKALAGCTSVQCSLCMRQPGLWNYINISSDRDQECSVDSGSDSEPELDRQMNEVEDLQTSNNCSPCGVIDGQLPSDEVYFMQSTTDDVNVSAAVEDSLQSPTSEKCLDFQKSLALSQRTDDAQDALPYNDNEPSSVAVSFGRDDNCECITDDLTDTDKHEDNSAVDAAADRSLSSFLPSESKHSDVEQFPEAAKIVSDNENVAGDRPQDTGTLEKEPGPIDTDLTVEIEASQSKDDSDELGILPDIEDTSYVHETEPDSVGDDVEEALNITTDIVTAHDLHSQSCQQQENVSDRSPGVVSWSENVEEDIHDRNNAEDVSSASIEPVCCTVTDNPSATSCVSAEPASIMERDSVNAIVEFQEEAVHETESTVQLEEQLEGKSAVSESLLKKSLDGDDVQQTILG